jgi:hypothetical protein
MSDKNALEGLLRMRELLATPDRWTQGVLAKDANGAPVSCDSDRASCWCFVGASFGAKIAPLEVAYLAEAMSPYAHWATWNDAPERTHADVLDLIDRAIEIARAET